jgi:hypothetical protein
VKPLGARKPVDRLEPHPACKLAFRHWLALPLNDTPGVDAGKKPKTDGR